jgi:hypothetical protein
MRNALAVLVLSILPATQSRADTVVVTADRMIDVLAGRGIERPQITITDGRIVAVGTQGGAIPTGARPRRAPWTGSPLAASSGTSTSIPAIRGTSTGWRAC